MTTVNRAVTTWIYMRLSVNTDTPGQAGQWTSSVKRNQLYLLYTDTFKETPEIAREWGEDEQPNQDDYTDTITNRPRTETNTTNGSTGSSGKTLKNARRLKI